MSNRVVYGNTHSLNGWPMVDQGSCRWVKVPGTNVTLQIREGQPEKILAAFAADFNAYVEPLRDADSACWTATNDVPTSNHLSGTAMDLNWNGADGRTFRLGIPEERAYPPPKNQQLRELLDWYEDMVFCGGFWNIRDWMHLEMGGNTYGSQNVERVNDFIRRKIRADGFSTFKRGGTPQPPPPPPPLSKQDQYALAVMAEGRRRGITPRGIQIAFSVVYVESNWKMYANSKVPESLKLPHDAVGQDHDSVGLFQQRCPMWGPAHVLMDPTQSAGLFYDRLAKLDYNGSRPPGDYAADVQRPAAQYRGRYQERMGDAIALYNRLATTAPTPPAPAPIGDDDLSAEAERMIREMYAEYRKEKRGPSRAFLAEDGSLIESPLGFLYNIDGNIWDVKLTLSYLFHVPLAITVVEHVAAHGCYPDTWAGSQAWLDEFGQAYCQGLVGFKKKLVAKLTTVTTSGGSVDLGGLVADIKAAIDQRPVVNNATVDTSELSRLHDENARLREELAAARALQVVYHDTTPDPDIVNGTVATADDGPRTSGDFARHVVDAQEDWTEHVLSMPVAKQAALVKSLKALELPNGASS